MTTISILPEPTDASPTNYRAVAGELQSVGNTVGEALDALRAKLNEPESTTLVVVQLLCPDPFFTAQQQQRLQELMTRWRAARDARSALPSGEQAELDVLVEAEVRAAGQRAAAPEAVFNFPFEIEHVVPPGQQGPDDESNWALACRSCNLRKSNHLTGVDETTQNQERLFHSRRDLWDHHFVVNRGTGAIQGTTPTGRATVARLQMNTSLQLEGRKVWIRLGLFP